MLGSAVADGGAPAISGATAANDNAVNRIDNLSRGMHFIITALLASEPQNRVTWVIAAHEYS
jgi:hypothetical protein